MTANISPPGEERRVGLVHREITLLVVLTILAVFGFLITRAVASANTAMRRNDAAAWFARGQQDLSSGQTDAAMTALRRATVRDPSNRRYRIALAGALEAAHHTTDARKVLEGLRDLQPDDANTNLELARLEANQGDVAAARRYYLSTLSALWMPGQADARTQVRIELVRFLLANGERNRALAELLNLTVGLPEDATTQAQVGRMFLEAGDPSQAMDHFSRALRADSRNEDALTGAAEAAFALGNYASARRYLALAPRGNRVVQLRTIVDLVFSSDPLARGLSPVDREQRLVTAYGQATSTLDGCMARKPSEPAGIAAKLDALRAEARGFDPVVHSAAARNSRDVAESVVDVILRIEQAVEQSCGKQGPLDQALLLIGRRHEE